MFQFFLSSCHKRLDGTMDANQRAAAIAEFKKRSDCRLFLISLKAGGCGLNLTEVRENMLLRGLY